MPLPGLLDQPLSLSFAHLWIASLYLTDANGVAVATWSLPGGPPFVDRPLWFQGTGGTIFPLLESPPTGGIMR